MASNEYNEYIRSANWYAKSAQFKATTGRRCVMFPWMEAQVSHHLTYTHLKSEKYIRDCIPLSRFAHGLIHETAIGKFFWKDRLGRRRVMNFVLRLMAIVVTTGVFAFHLLYLLREVIAPSPGVLLQSRPYFQSQLKQKPKLKNRRNKSKKRQ